jgi:(2Fe-2S) ferredoxin
MQASRPLNLTSSFAACLLAALLALPPLAPAQDASVSTRLGIRAAQLDAGYWITRQRAPDHVLLDRDAVATLNVALQASEPSLHDIEALPPTLEAQQVRAWVEAISVEPRRTLYDANGGMDSQRAVDRLMASLALKSIPQTQVTRYGMVVRRADLRRFPSRLRVFHAPGDTDIDRFQETALFPGTPVAIVHESRDRAWYFVVSPNYAAWIEKQHIAKGDRQVVFEYGRRSPFAVVTGATVRTVHTPEKPQVSGLQLDMGVRMPLLVDWPDDKPVNGQHPGYAWVVQLPIRTDAGALDFSPALLPRSVDVSDDYLTLTRVNLLQQAFKFLGERYGWGHDYGARDCSGFVAEVYRSFGLHLPRNTGDQAGASALNRIALDAGMGHDDRLGLLRESQVGDLLYIPGHVMMVIGHEADTTWIIHDIHGMHLRGDDGSVQRLLLNGVVVTPLAPMLAADGSPIVDHITAIQRIRP